MLNKKDCSTCKSGHFNEHWGLLFCYNKATCKNWELWEPKEMKNALEYKDLREKIHSIFIDFLERELECHQSNEFDFEWMEFKTDDILTLIKRQGGKISND